MKKENEMFATNAGLINLLIKHGYKSKTIKAIVRSLQTWIDKVNHKQSPVDRLSDELILNYLYYLLVYYLDALIGNEQPFNHHQDYQQETNRFLKDYLASNLDGNGETDLQSNKNIPSYLFDNNEVQPNDVDWNIRPSTKSFTVQYFTYSFIETVLDDQTFSNFVKYLELYTVDATINNCRPFCVYQNYEQELIRQHKTKALIDLVKRDETFRDLFYTIDCIVQHRFMKSLGYSTHKPAKTIITKLW